MTFLIRATSARICALLAAGITAGVLARTNAAITFSAGQASRVLRELPSPDERAE
jgi:hypothetical protein